jgi:tetratricopeptide (TPR) repeat protein
VFVHPRVLNRLGAFYCYLGQFERATTLIQSGLTHARALDLRAEVAFCLRQLSDMTAWQGQYRAAYKLFQESLTISRALGDQSSVAYTLGRLSESLLTWGDFAGAKQFAQESLTISQGIGRIDQAALAHRMLGYTTVMLGEYKGAALHFQESLHSFEEVDDRLGMAMALGGFAWLASITGDIEPATAKNLGERSLALVRTSGHRVLASSILYIVGQLHTSMHEDQQAQQCFQEGLATARMVGIAALIVGCASALGYLHCRHGDFPASRQAFREALHASSTANVPPNTLEALIYYATLLMAESKSAPAEQAAAQQTQAIEQLSLALHHPAAWYFLRTRAARLLAELTPELPPALVADAQTRGKNSTIDETLAKILAELKMTG